MFNLHISKPEKIPDVIRLGTPSTGGQIDVHGDFDQPESFKLKIDNAISLRAYANRLMKSSFDPPE
jgi:hypothetical protein